MTREEAKKLLGKYAQWERRAMARALAIHSWLNSEAEWKLAEALRALGYRNAPKRQNARRTD